MVFIMSIGWKRWLPEAGEGTKMEVVSFRDQKCLSERPQPESMNQTDRYSQLSPNGVGEDCPIWLPKVFLRTTTLGSPLQHHGGLAPATPSPAITTGPAIDARAPARRPYTATAGMVPNRCHGEGYRYVRNPDGQPPELGLLSVRRMCSG